MTATHRIMVGDVLDKLAELPEKSVHCCGTSPPYYGLRIYSWGGDGSCKQSDGRTVHEWPETLPPGPIQECRRCGAKAGTLGLEPTIDEYVAKMVEVLGAVRRVLRDDGTLWLNLGNSYSSGDRDTYNAGTSKKHHHMQTGMQRPAATANGLKPLDLCNVPHRVASALQADGWYWRSTIIWAKGLSLCDEYAGSVMPESLSGWRWERCRVKVRDSERETRGHHVEAQVGVNNSHAKRDGRSFADQSDRFVDCPGCPKCKPNGGYVLRKGSWRPTSAYEFMFMFSKTAYYYCDGEAVREESAGTGGGACFGAVNHDGPGSRRHDKAEREQYDASRNLRNVWVSPPDGAPLTTDVLVVNPQAFKAAHFATFPEKLVEPIVKAATSDKGVCPECGAPWARVIERGVSDYSTGKRYETGNADTDRRSIPGGQSEWDKQQPTRTLGWKPTCGCGRFGPVGDCPLPVPATVLDPFVGSGTTCLVACKLGRNAIGIELNPEYALMAEDRIGKGLRPDTYRPQCNNDEDAPLFAGAGG